MPLPRLPELVAAQHRYRYLVRRHGWRAVFSAFTDALDICLGLELFDSGTGRRPWQRRIPALRQLHHPRDHGPDTPLRAATYPEVVALSTLLLPVHPLRDAWRRPHGSPERSAFYREAHRRMALRPATRLGD